MRGTGVACKKRKYWDFLQKIIKFPAKSRLDGEWLVCYHIRKRKAAAARPCDEGKMCVIMYHGGNIKIICLEEKTNEGK